MPRTVHTFLPLSGDPAEAIATFLGDPAHWLPEARHTGLDRWELWVSAGPVERQVEVVIGGPWRLGRTWWRSWSWTPLPDTRDPVAVERLLPALDAELGLTTATDGRLTLVLDGCYYAPGGLMGEALDAVAMGRVARRSLERLLSAVAAELTAPQPVEH